MALEAGSSRSKLWQIQSQVTTHFLVHGWFVPSVSSPGGRDKGAPNPLMRAPPLDLLTSLKSAPQHLTLGVSIQRMNGGWGKQSMTFANKTATIKCHKLERKLELSHFHIPGEVRVQELNRFAKAKAKSEKVQKDQHVQKQTEMKGEMDNLTKKKNHCRRQFPTLNTRLGRLDRRVTRKEDVKATLSQLDLSGWITLPSPSRAPAPPGSPGQIIQ